MKHVRALTAEPPLLAQYRAAYPDEETRPATEATATWDGFKSDQPAYAELLARLAEAQQGLCIYCEQRLVDGKGKLVPNDRPRVTRSCRKAATRAPSRCSIRS